MDREDKKHKMVISYTVLLVFVFALTFLIIGFRYQYVPLTIGNTALVMKVDRITGDYCYIWPKADIYKRGHQRLLKNIHDDKYRRICEKQLESLDDDNNYSNGNDNNDIDDNNDDD